MSRSYLLILTHDSCRGNIPATPGNAQDEAAVKVSYEAQLGWMADPVIYGEKSDHGGSYHQCVLLIVF